MTEFMSDTMPVNATFYNALSNDIEHPQLLSGVRFRIMDDPVHCELRAISIKKGTPWNNSARSRFFPSGIPGAIFQ